MDSPSYDWARVNDTELYQICRKAGLDVLPRDSREHLIALLEGYEEQSMPENYHPIDTLRDALMAFVIDHWSKIQSQVTCPAKTCDPRACYGCVDQQVVACFVKNQPLQTHILIRRKTP